MTTSSGPTAYPGELAVSAVLKEIGERISKLTYREMTQLAGMISAEFSGDPTPEQITSALLMASDRIRNAAKQA